MTVTEDLKVRSAVGFRKEQHVNMEFSVFKMHLFYFDDQESV